MSDSVRPHRRQPTRLPCPWDSPGKNTGVGCHALLQGIFPTQGLSLGLPHCKQILHQLANHANPMPSLHCQVNGGSGSNPRPAGLEAGPGEKPATVWTHSGAEVLVLPVLWTRPQTDHPRSCTPHTTGSTSTSGS